MRKRSKLVSVRLPDDVYELLVLEAEGEMRSLSAHVLYILACRQERQGPGSKQGARDGR